MTHTHILLTFPAVYILCANHQVPYQHWTFINIFLPTILRGRYCNYPNYRQGNSLTQRSHGYWIVQEEINSSSNSRVHALTCFALPKFKITAFMLCKRIWSPIWKGRDRAWKSCLIWGLKPQTKEKVLYAAFCVDGLGPGLGPKQYPARSPQSTPVQWSGRGTTWTQGLASRSPWIFST